MKQQKVMKVGNSLAVTVPSAFAKSAGILAGSQVKVIVRAQTGKIVYQFDNSYQLPLENFWQHDKK